LNHDSILYNIYKDDKGEKSKNVNNLNNLNDNDTLNLTPNLNPSYLKSKQGHTNITPEKRNSKNSTK